jgi:MYXO-CTERM domain-containing protein
MRTTRHLLAAIFAGLLFCSPVHAAIITLEAALTGANEVPGPGDPDGSGHATFTIDTIALTVVWNVTVDGLDTVVAAHIHPGAEGVAGPPLIDLSSGLTGGPLQSGDLAQVIANPSAFYYNVHTDVFPAGAIRGQLRLVQVPEAGGAGLMLLGLMAAAWLRRRT